MMKAVLLKPAETTCSPFLQDADASVSPVGLVGVARLRAFSVGAFAFGAHIAGTSQPPSSRKLNTRGAPPAQGLFGPTRATRGSVRGRTYVRYMPKGFHPRKQGDIGEVEAMRWLTSIGADVWVPLGHSRDIDVIAVFEQQPIRIQVKSSSRRIENGRFSVNVCTNGGNQSWTGIVRYFEHTRCDFLFVWLTDDRRWFIPSTAVDGTRGINLGGVKYSEFEIGASGAVPPASLRCLQCPTPTRGSAVVGETGGPVKSVPSAEWVRFPPPPSIQSPQDRGIRGRAYGRTTISSGHQITIPIGPFTAAELAPGDRFEVTAAGPGSVRIERIHQAEPATVQAELPAA
jgi:PD-(D/E)XK nuclease superfamily protein